MTQHELQIEPYDGKHREDVRATAYLRTCALYKRARLRVYVAGVRVNTPLGLHIEVPRLRAGGQGATPSGHAWRRTMLSRGATSLNSTPL